MKSITIESAEEAFYKWRLERSSRAELIPEYLWAMALQPAIWLNSVGSFKTLASSSPKMGLDSSSALF